MIIILISHGNACNHRLKTHKRNRENVVIDMLCKVGITMNFWSVVEQSNSTRGHDVNVQIFCFAPACYAIYHI